MRRRFQLGLVFVVAAVSYAAGAGLTVLWAAWRVHVQRAPSARAAVRRRRGSFTPDP